MEIYVELCVGFMVQLWAFDLSTTIEKFSIILAIFTGITLIYFPFFIVTIINSPKNKISSKRFERKFGTLTEEYKSKTNL